MKPNFIAIKSYQKPPSTVFWMIMLAALFASLPYAQADDIYTTALKKATEQLLQNSHKAYLDAQNDVQETINEVLNAANNLDGLSIFCDSETWRDANWKLSSAQHRLKHAQERLTIAAAHNKDIKKQYTKPAEQILAHMAELRETVPSRKIARVIELVENLRNTQDKRLKDAYKLSDTHIALKAEKKKSFIIKQVGSDLESSHKHAQDEYNATDSEFQKHFKELQSLEDELLGSKG